MKKPTFVTLTKSVCDSIREEIEEIRKPGKIKKDAISPKHVVTSAYCKSYDFLMFLCDLDVEQYKHSFFYVSTLRSICEDLIALTYLISHSENDQKSLIYNKQHDEFKKTLEAQETYFKNNNPVQIVPLPASILRDRETTLSVLDFTPTDQRFPKVHRMANVTGFTDLYDFLYHATCKTVHFDITTLLKMGWGKLDEETTELDASFSYKHNYHHWFNFALFYASKLFLLQTDKFQEILNIQATIPLKTQVIKDAYQKMDWATIIEFRHLNRPEPSELQRLTYRMFKEGAFDNKEGE